MREIEQCSKKLTKKKAMIILGTILAIGMFLLGIIPSNPPLAMLVPILAIVGLGATSPIIPTYAVLSDIINEDIFVKVPLKEKLRG